MRMSESTTQPDATNPHAAVVAAINRDLVPPGLVGAETCLHVVFPDESTRPCLRTFRSWQRLRIIPFRKISRRTFFDPVEVRRALDRQFTVHAR